MKKIILLFMLLTSAEVFGQSQANDYMLAMLFPKPFSSKKYNIIVDRGNGENMKKISDEFPGSPEIVNSWVEMLKVIEGLGYEYINSFPGNPITGPYGAMFTANEGVSLFRKKAATNQ